MLARLYMARQPLIFVFEVENLALPVSFSDRHLQSAAALEDNPDFSEPPDWLSPTRESLGATLLVAGRSSEAESVFREDLKRNPRNPPSLFGLAECLRAEGKAAEASAVQRQFAQGWRNADARLSLSGLGFVRVTSQQVRYNPPRRIRPPHERQNGCTA